MVLGVVLACALLAICAAASSAYASGGFGIERFSLTATEEDSSADTQAGSHPHALTLETTLAPVTGSHEVRDLDVELPSGLIVDPRAVPQAGAVGEVEMMAAASRCPRPCTTRRQPRENWVGLVSGSKVSK